MKLFGINTVVVFAVLAGAAPVVAAPQEDSCTLLDIIGGNKTTEVEVALTEMADRWLTQSRVAVVEQLQQILAPAPFIGGSVYRVAKLGDDLEEHIMLLRLRRGEIVGVRLRYEWTPDGLKLTGFDLKEKIDELSVIDFGGAPVEIACS